MVFPPPTSRWLPQRWCKSPAPHSGSLITHTPELGCQTTPLPYPPLETSLSISWHHCRLCKHQRQLVLPLIAPLQTWPRGREHVCWCTGSASAEEKGECHLIKRKGVHPTRLSNKEGKEGWVGYKERGKKGRAILLCLQEGSRVLPATRRPSSPELPSHPGHISLLTPVAPGNSAPHHLPLSSKNLCPGLW